MTRDFTTLVAARVRACRRCCCSSLARRRRNCSRQNFRRSMGLMLRWGVLLAILLAIGYVTEQSADFPRRVIVTWAIVTPVFLIAVTLWQSTRLARRVIARPQNSRSVVFVGCTDASISLGATAGPSSRAVHVRAVAASMIATRNASRQGDLKLLGRFSDLPAYVKENHIDAVFIALPLRHMRRMQNLAERIVRYDCLAVFSAGRVRVRSDPGAQR